MHPTSQNTPVTAIDLFAGPGGWDVAARDLGIDVVGIEWDHSACETRRAAGLATIEGDVSKYGPGDFEGYEGLIASPPCQTFSMAGGGAGRRALDDVLTGVKELAARQELTVVHGDPRTGLVLEPLRWALEAIDNEQPYRWLAFEQVPTVLPVWEAIDAVLEAEGYSSLYGYAHAEQYGVPQTRKRAVLIARLDGPVTWPQPTHSKYHSRNPERLDAGILPWVSMAQALGWDPDANLAVRSNYGSGGDPAARGMRAIDQPAAAVTSKFDRNKWVLSTGVNQATVGPGALRDELMAAGRWREMHKPQERPVDCPAPTVDGKASGAWMMHAPGGRAEWLYRNGNQKNAAKRAPDSPAPTVHFGSRSNKVEWMPTAEADDPSASGIRVTVAEASTFQTFPADYPWQGTQSKRAEQVGNAVPPTLARAILSAVTS